MKFGEIHKLGFIVMDRETQNAPTPVFDYDTEDFPGEPIAEKAVAAVIGYRDRNPCRPAVRGGVRELGC